MIILGYFQSHDLKILNENLISSIQKTNQVLLSQSVTALNDLGEKIIKQNATDVAKEVEIYLKANPKLTSADLRKDKKFREIAVQLVGDTGYTALNNSDNFLCLLHKQPKIEGIYLTTLATTLPQFWEIMSKTKGGNISYGYYDWKEPDGTIRKKYMYIIPVAVKTADNMPLAVAATTYIDEFSRPSTNIQKIIDKGIDELIIFMSQANNNSLNQLLILISILILSSLIVGYFFIRQISRPLKALTKAVKNAHKEDFVVDDVVINSNDELGILADTFKQMFIDIKKSRITLEEYNKTLKKEVDDRTKELQEFKVNLEKVNLDLESKVKERTSELEKLKDNLEEKVKERTTELDQKIQELESMNRYMIDRENKMVELKEELEKCKKGQ
jgi:methyl-accepting chemotaxis protein